MGLTSSLPWTAGPSGLTSRLAHLGSSCAGRQSAVHSGSSPPPDHDEAFVAQLRASCSVQTFEMKYFYFYLHMDFLVI